MSEGSVPLLQGEHYVSGDLPDSPRRTEVKLASTGVKEDTSSPITHRTDPSPPVCQEDFPLCGPTPTHKSGSPSQVQGTTSHTVPLRLKESRRAKVSVWTDL